MSDNLLDTRLDGASPPAAPDFMSGVLDSCTRYSVIAGNHDGLMLVWNEGAHRMYGYDSEEILGRAKWEMLFESRDVLAAKPREILASVFTKGLWEGIVAQIGKNHKRFTAEVSLTPWRDRSGQAIGFLMIVKELANAQVPYRFDAMFRELMESAPDAVIIATADGRIVAVNSQTEAMFGHARNDLLEQSVEMLVPARLRRKHAMDRSRYLREPAPRSRDARVELIGLRKDGSEFPAEISLSPLETAAGPVTIRFIRDLSESRRVEESRCRRAERALQVSEEKFRSAFEHTNVAMVLTDIAHRFVRVNAAFARMFGYTPEEMLHMSMVDIIHPDDLTESFARREELLANQGAFNQTEQRYFNKSGQILWALTNIALVRDTSGAPLLFVGQVQDISERKRAEEALRHARNRLQYLVSSSPAVLFTLTLQDEDACLAWVSDNIREMLGYSVDEALHPEWWRGNLHPEDLPRVMAQIRDELPMHNRVASEFRFRDRGGKFHWVRNELRLLRDLERNPIEVVGSWSDLTERKHLEDQMRQAQKMEAIGRLAGGVAHDFNNLLTVINGYSEILIGHIQEGNPLREFVEQILSAGERAASLTRQLLTFSRRQMIVPVVLDLGALLKEMERMLSRLIGEDIEMTIVAKPNLWRVKVDPGQMEQVVMNLVVNARDAMPKGGKLTIEIVNVDLDENPSIQLPAGSYVMLAVSDSGCGMDQATQARVFEPFFTTKGPDKGTGLGLATVYGIVKQNGGRISVYSELGVGTTFKVLLPRAGEALSTSKAIMLPPTPNRGTESVLLVEDEESVRTLSRRVLEKNGYRVIDARNGAEGLLLCQHHPEKIDIMVTDVVMPNMSGRTLAQHLSTLRPNMKVLYLSGYTDEAIVRHGVIDPDTPFLQKPFTPDALARKVREVLDAPKYP